MNIDKTLMDCLETVVGLTRQGSTCWDALPVDQQKSALVTTSKSDLFIDEAENFNAGALLAASPGIAPGTLWDKLLFARKAAVRDVVMQVTTSLAPQFTSSINRTILIGEQSYQGPIASGIGAGELTYLWQTKNLPGGFITLSDIGFLGRVKSDSGTPPEITVTVKRLGQSQLLGSYTIKVLSNEAFPSNPDTDLYPLGQDLRLPADGSVYEIGYVYDPTKYTPFDNKLRCVVCTSGQSDLTSFFRVLPTGSAFGLMWRVTFSCNTQYLACALLDNQALGMLIADLLQYRTIEWWLSLILKTNNLGTTSETVLDSAQLPEIRDQFAAMYASRLTSLFNQIEFQNVDMGCFVCRQDYRGGRVPNILGDSTPVEEYNNYTDMTLAMPILPQ